jgi:hypothetical protein
MYCVFIENIGGIDMAFKKALTSPITFNMEKSIMKAFKKKLKSDKITATHFMASMIFAYICGDIILDSRPVTMKQGRLFYYREGEEPSDVLGIKFSSARNGMLINPTRFSFPSPEFEYHEFETSQLKPFQFKKKQDK